MLEVVCGGSKSTKKPHMVALSYKKAQTVPMAPECFFDRGGETQRGE